MKATDLVGEVLGARIELRDKRLAAEAAHAVYRDAIAAEQVAHARYMDALGAIEKHAAAVANDLPPDSEGEER